GSGGPPRAPCQHPTDLFPPGLTPMPEGVIRALHEGIDLAAGIRDRHRLVGEHPAEGMPSTDARPIPERAVRALEKGIGFRAGERRGWVGREDAADEMPAVDIPGP